MAQFVTKIKKAYFFKKTRKMCEKCFLFFYCLHFDSTFLALITILTFMQNLEKTAPKIEGVKPP